MSVQLEAIRDHLKTVVANHDSLVTNAQVARDAAATGLAAVEAELARVPTLDDVKAMVSQIPG